jgi:hypothetical protein
LRRDHELSIHRRHRCLTSVGDVVRPFRRIVRARRWKNEPGAAWPEAAVARLRPGRAGPTPRS